MRLQYLLLVLASIGCQQLAISAGQVDGVGGATVISGAEAAATVDALGGKSDDTTTTTEDKPPQIPSQDAILAQLPPIAPLRSGIPSLDAFYMLFPALGSLLRWGSLFPAHTILGAVPDTLSSQLQTQPQAAASKVVLVLADDAQAKSRVARQNAGTTPTAPNGADMFTSLLGQMTPPNLGQMMSPESLGQFVPQVGQAMQQFQMPQLPQLPFQGLDNFLGAPLPMLGAPAPPTPAPAPAPAAKAASDDPPAPAPATPPAGSFAAFFNPSTFDASNLLGQMQSQLPPLPATPAGTPDFMAGLRQFWPGAAAPAAAGSDAQASDISEVRVKPGEQLAQLKIKSPQDLDQQDKQQQQEDIPLLWFRLPMSQDESTDKDTSGKPTEDQRIKNKLQAFERQVIAELKLLQHIERLAKEMRAQATGQAQGTPSFSPYKLNYPLSRTPVHKITRADIERALRDDYVRRLLHKEAQRKSWIGQKSKYIRDEQIEKESGAALKRQANLSKEEIVKMMAYAYRMASEQQQQQAEEQAKQDKIYAAYRANAQQSGQDQTKAMMMRQMAEEQAKQQAEQNPMMMQQQQQQQRQMMEEQARQQAQQNPMMMQQQQQQQRQMAEEQARLQQAQQNPMMMQQRQMAEDQIRAQQQRQLAEEQARRQQNPMMMQQQQRQMAEEQARAQQQRQMAEEQARQQQAQQNPMMMQQQRQMAEEQARQQQAQQNPMMMQQQRQMAEEQARQQQGEQNPMMLQAKIQQLQMQQRQMAEEQAKIQQLQMQQQQRQMAEQNPMTMMMMMQQRQMAEEQANGQTQESTLDDQRWTDDKIRAMQGQVNWAEDQPAEAMLGEAEPQMPENAGQARHKGNLYGVFRNRDSNLSQTVDPLGLGGNKRKKSKSQSAGPTVINYYQSAPVRPSYGYAPSYAPSRPSYGSSYGTSYGNGGYGSNAYGAGQSTGYRTAALGNDEIDEMLRQHQTMATINQPDDQREQQQQQQREMIPPKPATEAPAPAPAPTPAPTPAEAPAPHHIQKSLTSASVPNSSISLSERSSKGEIDKDGPTVGSLFGFKDGLLQPYMGLLPISQPNDPWTYKAYDPQHALYTGGGSYATYLKEDTEARRRRDTHIMPPHGAASHQLLTPGMLERLLRIKNEFQRRFPQLYKGMLYHHTNRTRVEVKPPLLVRKQSNASKRQWMTTENPVYELGAAEKGLFDEKEELDEAEDDVEEAREAVKRERESNESLGNKNNDVDYFRFEDDEDENENDGDGVDTDDIL